MRELTVLTRILVLASGALLSLAAGASAASQTFNFTDAERTFTVPEGVDSIRLTMRGGHGGDSGTTTNAKRGGWAHYLGAVVPVTPGQVLYVNVGGNGATGSAGSAPGGFNGGGSANAGAGGGGGATDVRTQPRAISGSLSARLVVAAGGGGGTSGDGCNTAGCPGIGGDAGTSGAAGQNGATCTAARGGSPGALAVGGAGGAGAFQGAQEAPVGLSGHAGEGGPGGAAGQTLSGGGGGGGYFGGGGGGAGFVFSSPICFGWPGAGGGGSSYAHPSATLTRAPEVSPGQSLVIIGYDPPNQFSFGKPRLSKRKGTAKLPVKVPGGGALKLARSKKVKGAQGTAAGAGTVKLSVVPRGAAKRKLRKRGRATVKAVVTFTPTDGEPRTKTKSLTLVKR